MARIEFFEPAPTCIDGVCTLGENQDLARIDTMVAALVDDGWDITRYNPITAPDVFSATPVIADLIREKGPDVLPITLVDSEVKKMREYPSSIELGNWLIGRD